MVWIDGRGEDGGDGTTCVFRLMIYRGNESIVGLEFWKRFYECVGHRFYKELVDRFLNSLSKYLHGLTDGWYVVQNYGRELQQCSTREVLGFEKDFRSSGFMKSARGNGDPRMWKLVQVSQV